MRKFEPRSVLVGGVGGALLVGVTFGLVMAVRPSGANEVPDDATGRAAHNVILLVGDGLGIAAREATRLTTVGQDGRLAMDSLEYAGWTSTDPADATAAVTDSAAGATAFATGVRTRNGAVAVDAEGAAVQTLLELAAAQGMSTGLVTTSGVTDATPAAFAAHVVDRSAQSEIARQYLEGARPDVILGGGADAWRADGGSAGTLVERAQDLGYAYVTTRGELDATNADRVLGLFADGSMFTAAPEGEGDAYAPVVPLQAMAAKALDVLSRDPDGLFLLVEEEAIDEMAHSNNATRTMEAVRALDETVALAQEFAATHPDTLVLVVGDHETGGFAIEDVGTVDESGDPGAPQSLEDGPFTVAGTDVRFTVDWTTGSHTGAATPLTAQGPGADRLARAQDATAVHDVVADVLRRR